MVSDQTLWKEVIHIESDCSGVNRIRGQSILCTRIVWLRPTIYNLTGVLRLLKCHSALRGYLANRHITTILLNISFHPDRNLHCQDSHTNIKN